MKKLLLPIMLSTLSLPAMAIDTIPWTQVSASIASVNIDDYSLSGLAASGTKLITDDVFIAGRFESTSETLEGTNVEIGLFRVSLGLGYRHAISDSTDLFGKVSYEDYTVSATTTTSSGYTIETSTSTSGSALEAGLRSLVTEDIEIGASITRLSIDGDSDTGLNLSAAYHASEKHSFALATSQYDDATFTEFKWAYTFN